VKHLLLSILFETFHVPIYCTSCFIYKRIALHLISDCAVPAEYKMLAQHLLIPSCKIFLMALLQ